MKNVWKIFIQNTFVEPGTIPSAEIQEWTYIPVEGDRKLKYIYICIRIILIKFIYKVINSMQKKLPGWERSKVLWRVALSAI